MEVWLPRATAAGQMAPAVPAEEPMPVLLLTAARPALRGVPLEREALPARAGARPRAAVQPEAYRVQPVEQAAASLALGERTTRAARAVPAVRLVWVERLSLRELAVARRIPVARLAVAVLAAARSAPADPLDRAERQAPEVREERGSQAASEDLVELLAGKEVLVLRARPQAPDALALRPGPQRPATVQVDFCSSAVWPL